MSPEQTVRIPSEIDARSDIYRLGVILYQMLSDRLPYPTHAALTEAIRVICEEDPEPLSSINRSYRGDIETIAAKALEKPRARRYASASEMASDIRRHLRHEPTVGRPATTAYRIGKFIRRYPALVAVSSGTLLLTAAFAVSMAVLASRYGHERDAAKIERTRAEQVSGFLSEMLTGADPNTAQGRKLTALDLLDSASARISKQLSGQPEVRAQLLETMGDAYDRLGIEDRGEAMFSALIAENGRLHGTAGVPAARAYRERGDVRRMIRDLPGAESDLRFSLAEPEKNSSASANEMPDAVNNLGLVPQAEGKTREARGLFERAVALSRNFPKEPTRTLTLMGNLGGVYIDLALYPEAERILCEVLERRRALLGDNHPRVPNTTMRLGYVLYLRGDYAGAEALYLNAIADLHRIVGTDHPDVIEDGNTLGRLYLETGRKSRSRGALPGCCR